MKDYKGGDNREFYGRLIADGVDEMEATIRTSWEGVKDDHPIWAIAIGDTEFYINDELRFPCRDDLIRSFKTYEAFKEFVETELAIARIKGQSS